MDDGAGNQQTQNPQKKRRLSSSTKDHEVIASRTSISISVLDSSVEGGILGDTPEENLGERRRLSYITEDH